KQDPLLSTASMLVSEGILTPDQILEVYEETRERVALCARAAARTPRLRTAEEVMAPLAPFHPERVAAEAARLPETEARLRAIGAGHLGLLPIPEIQYLAYYHNAEDQIRGEACSLQFFSNGQFRNPMVVRVQGWSYQKGFGGHFHNDNSIAAMRDVPGLIVAT